MSLKKDSDHVTRHQDRIPHQPHAHPLDLSGRGESCVSAGFCRLPVFLRYLMGAAHAAERPPDVRDYRGFWAVPGVCWRHPKVQERQAARTLQYAPFIRGFCFQLTQTLASFWVLKRGHRKLLLVLRDFWQSHGRMPTKNPQRCYGKAKLQRSMTWDEPSPTSGVSTRL